MDLLKKIDDLGYNFFDLNDSFYTDICSVFTYNNSDISLSERKMLLNLTDEYLCLRDCNFSKYDSKTNRSICYCKIDNSNNKSDSSADNRIVENEDFLTILKNIKNVNFSQSSNIKVVKCVSIIFRKNLFINNYGFYISFFLNFFTILLLICSPLSYVDKLLN